MTEILPRENSATSEAKSKRRDKITVFTLLALTGIVTGTMPAAVLTTVPLTIVFFFTQRYIFESEVVSGLKG